MHRIQTGHPFVTLTWAQSIDGSISARRGAALNLSGEESLRMTHQLRAAHEAIAVGIGTVLSDDPQLTVRLTPGRDPQVIILDSHLAFPEKARLLENPTPPWIASVEFLNQEKEAYLESRGVRLVHLPPDSSGRVDLYAFLNWLGASEINSIMVEGGSRIISSFLQSQLADLVVVTISPLFVGGLRIVEGLLSPMPRLKEFHSLSSGGDLIVWGVPEW
jgi:GTP cyclohydrolase II